MPQNKAFYREIVKDLKGLSNISSGRLIVSSFKDTGNETLGIAAITAPPRISSIALDRLQLFFTQHRRCCKVIFC